MKAIVFFVFFLFSIGNLEAQAPRWAWVKPVDGNPSFVSCVTTDNMEDVYMAGNLEDSTLTFNDSSYNIGKINDNFFLIKSDNDGNTIWVKTFKGTNHIVDVVSLATDKNGNIYMSGTYDSSVLILDADTIKVTPNYGLSFLIKFNPDGKILWANGYSGIERPSLAVDDAANVFVEGDFELDSISIGKFIIKKTIGIANIVVIKFDTYGNALWVHSGGGNREDEAGRQSIATDASGNVYISGFFSSNIFRMGGDSLVLNGGLNMFIAKYNTNGNLIRLMGANGGKDNSISNISTDKQGNLYADGGFPNGDSIILGSNIISAKSSNGFGNSSAFIVKYDSAGNVLWAKGLISTSYVNPWSIIPDNTGNLYLTGYYVNFMVLGGDTLFNNSKTAIYTTFVAQYDQNGNFKWGKTAEGYYSVAEGLTVSNSGDIYVVGEFEGTVCYFDSIVISYDSSFANTGWEEGYFAKIGGEIITSTNNISFVNNSISIFPNPCSTCYITGIDNPADLIVTDLLGRNIQPAFTKSSGGYSIQMQQYANGIYIVHDIKTGEAKKFVKD